MADGEHKEPYPETSERAWSRFVGQADARSMELRVERWGDCGRTFDPYAQLVAHHLAAACVATDTAALLEPYFARCESPIERRFLAAVLIELGLSQGGGEPAASCVEGGIALHNDVFVVVQRPVLVYRADFYLLHGEPPGLVVECDGREHHSSAEDRRRDRERDEAMRQAGYGVLRFTGAQVWRDAFGCAREAFAKLGGEGG